MMTFQFYILYSLQLDRYYIGATENLQERLNKHMWSSTGFTSKARDWKLIYSENYSSKKEAFDREKQVKRWKSRKMIQSLTDHKT